MKKIFEQRIFVHNSGKKEKIILEMKCNHTSPSSDCNDRVCILGNVTPEDIKIVEIGFNILIYFSYMEYYFSDPIKFLE